MNIHRGRPTTTHGYKNITLFIVGVKASVVRERQTDRERERERRIKTAMLIHSYLFSWPYHVVLSSRCYVFNSDETYSTGFQQQATRQSPTSPVRPWFSICRLNWPLQAGAERLPLSHIGISMYHFVTHTYFQSTTKLLPFIFSGASCLENFWLTARSKVNMRHFGTVPRALTAVDITIST